MGAAGIAFEIAAGRGQWLVLDAHRRRPALCILAKDDLPWADDGAPGSARQARLLFRKHAAGPRVRAIDRVPGAPFVVLSLGAVQMNLCLGPRPAITLIEDGRVLATLGEGEAWPTPEPQPASNDAISAVAVRPFVLAPRSLDELQDADVVNDASVEVVGEDALRAARSDDRVATPCPTWLEASAVVFRWRQRGERFRLLRRRSKEAITRERRRKETLKQHLEKDLKRIDEAETLRRTAEALLAAANVEPGPDGMADVPDPYEPSTLLRVAIAPALGPRGTADRMFERARRLSKARAALVQRLHAVDETLAALAQRAEALEAARGAEDLDPGDAPTDEPQPTTRAGPRCYLTTRGLTLWAGRGARENHELTFGKAKPDDLWFHVRDRPGAHVILMDNEGRATADDQREAAEVAAFLSDAASEGSVDVHATRRKHLRPVKGSPGRVVIGYSETLRVTPRDPEGRLRRR